MGTVIPQDLPSKAATSYFTKIKIERGLSERKMLKGSGKTSKSTIQQLFNGTRAWNLEDVERFAKYLEIPLKVAFSEIIKEMNKLTSESDCPCSEESLAG